MHGCLQVWESKNLYDEIIFTVNYFFDLWVPSTVTLREAVCRL